MIREQQTAEEQIKELELSAKDAKEAVELWKAAERLHSNPDFKKVVIDGYFLHEAARLTMAHANPSLSAEVREHIKNEMKGPGALKRYLSHLVQEGFHAQDALGQIEDAIAELHSVDLSGE